MSNKKKPSKAQKPKINKRKAWFKVAKKVHQLSKKQNLGWTWNESVKFASKNIYPEFKGKSQAQIKVSEITESFVLSTYASAQQVIPAPKKISNCFSPLLVPAEDLQEREWFFIGDDDVWANFPSNLPMRFAFDGIIDTGIIMKSQMPNMVEIREKMRAMFGNKSPIETFIFKVLVAPDKKDDGKPCSYYVLVTIADSFYDTDDQTEKFSSVSEDMLSDEEKLEREKKLEDAKKQKATRKQAKSRPRPSLVEPTTQTEQEPETEATTKPALKKIDLEVAKIEKERVASLTEALNIIREDFKDGTITKRRYIELQKKIIDKFEKGGKI